MSYEKSGKNMHLFLQWVVMGINTWESIRMRKFPQPLIGHKLGLPNALGYIGENVLEEVWEMEKINLLGRRK